MNLLNAPLGVRWKDHLSSSTIFYRGMPDSMLLERVEAHKLRFIVKRWFDTLQVRTWYLPGPYFAKQTFKKWAPKFFQKLKSLLPWEMQKAIVDRKRGVIRQREGRYHGPFPDDAPDPAFTSNQEEMGFGYWKPGTNKRVRFS